MGVYAYLRVSTDEQDVDNQRHGILEYANTHNLGGLQFVEDNASGKTNWKDRKMGELLTKTMPSALRFASASLVRIEINSRSISAAKPKTVAVILEFNESSNTMFCFTICTTNSRSAQ